MYIAEIRRRRPGFALLQCITYHRLHLDPFFFYKQQLEGQPELSTSRRLGISQRNIPRCSTVTAISPTTSLPHLHRSIPSTLPTRPIHHGYQTNRYGSSSSLVALHPVIVVIAAALPNRALWLLLIWASFPFSSSCLGCHHLRFSPYPATLLPTLPPLAPQAPAQHQPSPCASVAILQTSPASSNPVHTRSTFVHPSFLTLPKSVSPVWSVPQHPPSTGSSPFCFRSLDLR